MRAEQRAIGVVDVGDAAVAVAAHDQVALRFEKARGALLGLLELPVAVGKILDALASLAQLRVQLPMRETSRPIAPQAAPNSAAAPTANKYGS